MADFQAFRGLRYDLGRVGSLSDVTAPPYDVIDGELRDRLYERSEFNIVRVILNRGDDLRKGEDIYQRANRYLRNWEKDGVLQRDSLAAIYVYHQTFEHEGTTYRRRGFISRVRIEAFGEGNIYPHEETHPKAREDRVNLTRACNANLSQIFSVYSDPGNDIQDKLESAIKDSTPLTAVDDLGVKHELWLASNPAVLSEAASLFGKKALYVADGHHRYETATQVRDELRTEQSISDDHPANYVSMMCVSMDDPGMIVLPTHRLFRGLPELTSTQLIEKLGGHFDCDVVGHGAEMAQQLWEEVAVEGEQSTMAFYCRADDSWVVGRLTATGHSRMEERMPNRSVAWRKLGVSILHELVINELLEGADLPAPRYVRKISELVDGLKNGDIAGRDATGQSGSGKPFELAAIVMPAQLDDVRIVSENNERMPAKSTYFYPKLLTGLVINPLD